MQRLQQLVDRADRCTLLGLPSHLYPRFVERIILGYLKQNGIGRDLRRAENNADVDALGKQREALADTKDQLATLLRRKVLDMAGVEREAAILDAEIAAID